MIRNISKNMLFPTLIGAAVLGLAMTLLTIVARSPWTHSNLNLSFDSRYTRTEQMLVGAPAGFMGDTLAVQRASDAVGQGKQLFVADGCASCHGLDGRGGVVGPSIVGSDAEMLRTTTQLGPGGMPAYASGALRDNDLAAIAAFLGAAGK